MYFTIKSSSSAHEAPKELSTYTRTYSCGDGTSVFFTISLRKHKAVRLSRFSLNGLGTLQTLLLLCSGFGHIVAVISSSSTLCRPSFRVDLPAAKKKYRPLQENRDGFEEGELWISKKMGCLWIYSSCAAVTLLPRSLHKQCLLVHPWRTAVICNVNKLFLRGDDRSESFTIKTKTP